MSSRRAKNKINAKLIATRLRKKGLDVSIYKKKRGYGISVTRK